MHNGWNLGGSVTLDSQKYFSQEFSYNYSFSTFRLGLTVVENDSTSATVQNAFAFADTGFWTSQASVQPSYPYASLYIPLSRPDFAVGPALQLMHLDDAPIKKAPNYFKLGLSNIGLPECRL